MPQTVTHPRVKDSSTTVASKASSPASQLVAKFDKLIDVWYLVIVVLGRYARG
jgi:hypothetical protein